MKVLVTGGLGFIGNFVVQSLLSRQHTVSVIDLTSSYQPDQSFTYYSISINNKDKVNDVFAAELPDVVIHLAAQVNVEQSMKEPSKDASVNIIGTTTILEACKQFNVKKIIYASSAAVYGEPQYLGIDENHPLTPISYYGLSKLTGEHYIRLFHQLHGLTYTILRFANAFGPSSNAKNDVITKFVEQMVSHIRPTIFGNGKQTRDFIYVEDIAMAMIQSLEYGDNQTVNIGTNQPTNLNELVSLINELTNQNLKPIYQASRSGDITNSYLTNQQAIHHLNWKPMFSLEKGIKEILRHKSNQLY
ncbi:NAD-dependent epimerase/dehydratase family protein [Aquibacillus salsiterrae]|uniref:GDP-mannose 4,6-dehydratase n=1 Tax=Aquibacillus salsiterrae TaxID=2950439 RepID=A0A9X4AHA6_9BACI|nr:NAD-dependent epimerase/dehydratase family protein [Aquibacillus salsiterrae]MDC3417983.1 GDP-mannose 4,6-dehydratase [Aquibacillus salsiterrae]